MTPKAPETYGFTLVFADKIDGPSQDFTDAIFESGCDDSHISIREGILRISFDREARSFQVALTSAPAEIERTGLGLELSRVERDSGESERYDGQNRLLGRDLA